MTALDERRLSFGVEIGEPNTERACWQDKPCPPWCRNDHEDKDTGALRCCESLPLTVGLRLEPLNFWGLLGSRENWTMPLASVYLVHTNGESKPHVVAGVDDREFKMTLAEAKVFRANLDAAIKTAEEGES